MKSLRIFVLSSTKKSHTVVLQGGKAKSPKILSMRDFNDECDAYLFMKDMITVLRAGGAKVLECVA